MNERLPGRIHIGAATHDGGLVLNLRAGRWYALNGTAQLLCRELRRTDDLDAAVSVVATRYPTVSEQRIRDDARKLVEQLSDRDLVVLESPPDADHATSPEPPVFARNLSADSPYRLRARLALVLVVVLSWLPFRWTLALVTSPCRVGRTDATIRQTADILNALESVARQCPSRVACLEQSLAAVLTGALCGRRIDWVMGVAEDPYRFHAWVETGGVPVLSGQDPEFTEYRRVLAL